MARVECPICLTMMEPPVGGSGGLVKGGGEGERAGTYR